MALAGGASAEDGKPAAKERIKVPSLAARQAAKEYFGLPETLRLTREQSLALHALYQQYAPKVATATAAAAQAQQDLATIRNAQANRGRRQPADPNLAELSQKVSKEAGKQSRQAAGAVQEVRDQALAILTEKQRAEIGVVGWQPDAKKHAPEAPKKK